MANERTGHSLAALRARLLAARNAIVPDRHGHGWLPFVLLVFLLPIVFQSFTPDVVMGVPAELENVDALTGAVAMEASSEDAEMRIEPVGKAAVNQFEGDAASGESSSNDFVTMLYDGQLLFYAIPLFLVLYFLALRLDGYWLLLFVSLIGGAGCMLEQYNALALTYVCYAAALLGLSCLPLQVRFAALGLLFLMALAIRLRAEYGEFTTLAFSVPDSIYSLKSYFSSMIFGLPLTTFFFAHFYQAGRHKDQLLLLSRQQTGRMAALAERERIARDLHDLLGHTLSMIALKAELASELLSRDVSRTRREVDQVACIARDALAQVRSAVDGMRSAALQAELAAACELLDAVGVVLTSQIDAVTMAAEVESALAMVLRESVTNIQRHAGARHVRVSLTTEGDSVRLQVDDDGHGRSVRPGNGLNGMRERLLLVGGALEVTALQPRGIRVTAVVPAVQVPA